MDGFEVAEQVTNREELVGITIMMLTSDQLSSDIARCQELGVADYVVKPVRRSNLFQAISVALGSRRVGPDQEKIGWAEETVYDDHRPLEFCWRRTLKKTSC